MLLIFLPDIVECLNAAFRMDRRRRDAKYNKRRSDLQSKLVMGGLSAALLLFLGVAWSSTNSGKLSETPDRNEKPEKTALMHRIAQQSEGSEFDYFQQNLLKPFLIKRVPDTEGNRIAQQHIKVQMTQLGWHVQEDSFVDDTPYGRKSFTNIIAVQNPSATRWLTLACHFDSKYFEHFEFIGATDSAVPCAMMIDIARHLNDAFRSGKRLDTSLQLIFFDGEEAFVDWTDTDSLYGARHLARKMEQTSVKNGQMTMSQLQTMDAFILLDLIGTKTTQFKKWYPQTEQLYTQLQNIEMELAKEGLLEPRATFQKKRSNTYFTGMKGFYSSGGVSDDHLPFVQRNVPVMHLISTPFPYEWHTSLDTEAALHYPTINNIAKILRVFVVEYLQLTV